MATQQDLVVAMAKLDIVSSSLPEIAAETRKEQLAIDAAADKSQFLPESNLADKASFLLPMGAGRTDDKSHQ
jgi:hypothetical protein